MPHKALVNDTACAFAHASEVFVVGSEWQRLSKRACTRAQAQALSSTRALAQHGLYEHARMPERRGRQLGVL
eukprot:424773-Pleurochrysis_carterae.AAC.1